MMRKCPKCMGIMELEGRITNFGLVWYWECNVCGEREIR